MPGTFLVPLKVGRFALIDAEDVERVSAFTWSLKWRRKATHPEYAYSHKSESGKSVQLHRFILGVDDSAFVDHKNGNGLDNRRCNLRAATRSQNMANSTMPLGASGYRGARLDIRRNHWYATIQVERKKIYLGVHPTSESAARAYDKAARRYFGEFARLNFPEDHAD